VLEGKQAEVGQPGHLFIGGIEAKDTAGFFGLVRTILTQLAGLVV
jgi:hypothetical protein